MPYPCIKSSLNAASIILESYFLDRFPILTCKGRFGFSEGKRLSLLRVYHIFCSFFAKNVYSSSTSAFLTLAVCFWVILFQRSDLGSKSNLSLGGSNRLVSRSVGTMVIIFQSSIFGKYNPSSSSFYRGISPTFVSANLESNESQESDSLNDRFSFFDFLPSDSSEETAFSLLNSNSEESSSQVISSPLASFYSFLNLSPFGLSLPV